MTETDADDELSRMLVAASEITSAVELAGVAAALARALRDVFDSEADVRVTTGDAVLAHAHVGLGDGQPGAEPIRLTQRVASTPLALEIFVRAPRPTSPPSAHVASSHLVEMALAVAQKIAWLSEARDLARERQEILTIVSHDLRTPLQSVTLGLDALTMLGADSPASSTLARMQRSVTTMSRLLNDLLDVSRIHDGVLAVQMRACDVGKLMGEIAEQHAPIAAARGFAFESSATLTGSIVCDQGRLMQALSNLLANAIRHATAGPIVLRAARLTDAVRFEVVDHGPGIPQERRAHLFDRLYQASEGGRRGGLGLGLYIAKGIAIAHGGNIGVESEVGRGSTFWIDIAQRD